MKKEVPTTDKRLLLVAGRSAVAPDMDDGQLAQVMEDAGEGHHSVIEVAYVIPYTVDSPRTIEAVWFRVKTEVVAYDDGRIRIPVAELAIGEPRVHVFRVIGQVVTAIASDMYKPGSVGVLNCSKEALTYLMMKDGENAQVVFTPISKELGSLTPLPLQLAVRGLEFCGSVSFYQLLRGWVAPPEED